MISAHFSSLNMLFVCFGLLLVAAPYVLCTASFSMELMHRDSPKSPLYDPASTPSSRLDASIKRSSSRADYLPSVNSRSPNSPLNLYELEDPIATLTSHDTEFIIKAKFGRRKKYEAPLAMNTGSSLVWIVCYPCSNCYDTHLEKFSIKRSKTYEVLNCTHKDCSESGFKCGAKGRCNYNHSYGESSWVTGILSRDSIKLQGMQGSVIHLQKMTFGCTHKTLGHFPKYILGFLGLGGRRISFVRQLGSRGYQMKFSYCLPASITDTSKVYFGSSGRVIGDDIQSTRMEVTNFYIVTVDSITVGQEALRVDDKFVMDAGTFLTYVDKLVLANLIDMVVRNTNLPIIEVTPESTFKLCYSVTIADHVNLLPEITLNFALNAQFALKHENAFLSFPDQKAMCLAIVEKTSGGVSIIGSHAQVNHRIGFDLEKSWLSFRPEIC